MSLWDFLKLGKTSTPESIASLPQKLTELLPDVDEETRVKIAAISGLLACVANADFKVTKSEIEDIKTSLKQWCKLSDDQIKAVTEVALTEVAALASLDVHQYTGALDSLLSDEEKVGVLEALFHIAASDDEVSIDESEFIRHVGHGLRLDHHEYVAARATVLSHLKILKKD
tara:strand:+ start:2415 stop:2930 length:516 start_codon:yes stop_codon:yes gene_type:complete